MQRLKKIALWTLIVFVVYAIVKSPNQAADIARTGGDITVAGAKSIGSFFDALLNQK